MTQSTATKFAVSEHKGYGIHHWSDREPYPGQEDADLGRQVFYCWVSDPDNRYLYVTETSASPAGACEQARRFINRQEEA